MTEIDYHIHQRINVPMYTMDGKAELWEIIYYPIRENGKTNEIYQEPRALIQRTIKGGFDIREIPLRYLCIFALAE